MSQIWKFMFKQPDFTEIFQTTFGVVPKKVKYEVRRAPYLLHDLVFISSLIQDSRFVRKDIVLRGSTFRINIKRDCWELPKKEHRRTSELYMALSCITISPVSRIQWVFENTPGFIDGEEEMIHSIALVDHAAPPTCKADIVVKGFGWQSIVSVDLEQLNIRLRDLETPYLISECEKGRKKGQAPPS